MTKKEINKKAIQILKNEMMNSEDGTINIRHWVITKVGRKYATGYGLYGGVTKMDAWELLYVLIYEKCDYYGTTCDEREYLDELMEEKVWQKKENKRKKEAWKAVNL